MDKPATRQARPAILVHGGAWATPEGEREDHLKGVHRASMIGFETLLSGGSAVDAVQRAVEHMEADPTFNAGRGAALNARGEVQLDARQTLEEQYVAAMPGDRVFDKTLNEDNIYSDDALGDRIVEIVKP